MNRFMDVWEDVVLLFWWYMKIGIDVSSGLWVILM